MGPDQAAQKEEDAMHKAPDKKLNHKFPQAPSRKVLDTAPGFEVSYSNTANPNHSPTGSVVQQLTGSAVTLGLLITVAVIAARIPQENLFNILLYVLGLLNTMIFALYVKTR